VLFNLRYFALFHYIQGRYYRVCMGCDTNWKHLIGKMRMFEWLGYICNSCSKKFDKILPKKNILISWGKWMSCRPSKRFILLARLGKLPCHKKQGIFVSLFLLLDKCFIVHILDSNFVFCGPNLDLREYNIATQSSGRTGRHVVPLIYTLYVGIPQWPFYSGQLILMSNLPWGQVVKKVKLHQCLNYNLFKC
jgi:hypothetical protein